MQRDKVKEVELKLEGRKYGHHKFYCYVSGQRHIIKEKVIYLTLDCYPDSFSVTCEKHALSLIGRGWQER